jgi:rod shape-determining protein MreD
MKPLVYFLVLLLIIPLQASLLAPLTLGGIKPDLALAFIFVIGLVAGPVEGALVGIAIGLIQDIGSASLLGFTGLSRGIIGLIAGLLGRRVLDIESPTIVLFLVVFSVAEGIYISLFLQTTSGAVPFISLIARRIVPQALYTGLFGFLMLHLVIKKKVLTMLKRRDIQKEL